VRGMFAENKGKGEMMKINDTNEYAYRKGLRSWIKRRKKLEEKKEVMDRLEEIKSKHPITEQFGDDVTWLISEIERLKELLRIELTCNEGLRIQIKDVLKIEEK